MFGEEASAGMGLPNAILCMGGADSISRLSNPALRVSN